jgi:2-keto-4-pentenoate hydratase/2-oxohepta-3-ene-1,7-dioic acid hydratase in catechol pathway
LPASEKLDYELELACILGLAGRNISKAKAPSYIFGYSSLNDFSVRYTTRRDAMPIGANQAGFFAVSLLRTTFVKINAAEH